DENVTDPTPCTGCTEELPLGDLIADIDVLKEAVSGVTSFVPGEDVSYIITVTNYGPSDANNVNVIDTLPEGAASMSWTADNGTSGNGTLNEIIALANGASVIYTVTMHISSDYNESSFVNLVSAVDPDVTDPNTCTDCSETLPNGASADIVTTKSDGSEFFQLGTDIVYTINVLNTGPTTATNIQVTDIAPSGTTITSWSGNGLTNQPGNLENTIDVLEVGVTISYLVTVHIPLDYTEESVSNTVIVTSVTPDPDTSCLECTDTNTKDTDGDGIPDSVDLDSDNDGILDTVEQETATNGGDTDGDGIPDYLDLDSDNDGILDIEESSNGGTDEDGDGRVDGPYGENGFADELETSTDSGEAIDEPVDTDGDGIPDFQDVDSDNDGISDLVEGGTDPDLDTDNDGMIDADITDSDNDGIIDAVDPTIDGSSPATTPDTDGDGVDDYRDLDSDNDGLNDIDETDLIDGNGDGQVDDQGDLTDNSDLPDEDGDGIADYLDPNNPDLTPILDADGDGIVDGVDSDGDGIIDYVDDLPGEFGDAPTKVAGITTIVNSFTPNDDGVNDTFVVQNLQLIAPNFSMIIRNRYGNIVYQYQHNGDKNKEPRWWDGYSSGRMTIQHSNKLPVGTYFYVLRYNDGESKDATGWIYLNR
ncbi:MAG: gliding motility-associated C-terminal domain-containing protein, partial [Flavobacteriaceae bacterium]|nr:gliding motility-associated C-terminal domain-containing protein [Flavobacteriaceae bacterium]